MMATQRLNPDQVDFDSAIAEMRSENLSDDQIHKEIAAEFGTTIADQHLKRGVFAPKQESGIWPENWSRIPEQVPYELPIALASLGASYAAMKSDKAKQIVESSKRGFSSIKNRMFSPEAQPDMPGTALNQAAVADGALPSPTLASAPQTPAVEAAVVQDPTPEQIRIQKQQAAQAMIEGRPVVAGAGPVTQSVANSTTPAVVEPPPVMSAPATPVQPDIPTSEQAAKQAAQEAADAGQIKAGRSQGTISHKDAQILNNIEKGNVVAEVTSQVGKPPPAGSKKPVVASFKTAADIPEGMVFRPDVGNIDRSLVNILGTEGRLYAKDVLNEGKSFGTYKGADYNKKISELVNAYGEELKKITPSIDLTTREGRVAVGAPHTKNYGSALGKAAKVGGVLGTLMTVAQSANAKEAAQAVGESLLPIGLTPSTLAPGTLYTPAQQREFSEQLARQKAAERQKLGSPYRSVPPPR